MFPSAPFKGITPESRVTYRAYASRGLNGPEYRTATKKVISLLIFDDHVVVGGGFGTVVDDSNYIRHTSPRK